MPFKTRKKSNGKWEVYNTDTGESKGESDTEEKAINHMKALYANMPKNEKKAEKLDTTVPKDWPQ